MGGRKIIDRTGHRYGRLTVVREEVRTRCNAVQWLCICDCGKQITVRGGNLKSGNTASCGCMQGNRTHGMSTSQEYHCWQGLRQRCNNPNDPAYDSYGGRGIVVCPEWESFEAFYADMGPVLSPDHTIERIDNDGDYCPENCEWRTWDEQAINRRSNRWVTVDGMRKTVTQWSRDLEGSKCLVSGRMHCGWSPEDAASLPLGSRKPHG